MDHGFIPGGILMVKHFSLILIAENKARKSS